MSDAQFCNKLKLYVKFRAALKKKKKRKYFGVASWYSLATEFCDILRLLLNNLEIHFSCFSVKRINSCVQSSEKLKSQWYAKMTSEIKIQKCK